MLKPFLFQQVPNISAIRTEYELYTYLKDGTELCRMIGLVSQGRVLEGIVYRLEHKTCDILAAERLRLMRFDNRLIIDSFQKAICILKW